MGIAKQNAQITGTWRRMAAALLLSVVSACGQPMLAPMPMVGGLPLAPDMDALGSASPISVSFNETYKERIDLNEPIARRSAHNTDKSLFQMINGAKSTIDGAFYDIEDPGVVDAMLKAKARGIRIRLVTDTDNLVEKNDPSKPRAAVMALKKGGIPIVDDQRSAIMHHKFMVVDGKAVWMGSTNLTPTSLYRHNNNAMTLRSTQLAAAFSTEFKRLFERHEFGSSTRGIVEQVAPIQIGSAEVRVFFSPVGGGRQAVLAELAQAKKSVHFMTFSLTDVEVGKTMLEKAKAGVEVGGIFDRWLAAGQYSLFDQFKARRLQVLKDGNEALMHHKVIIVDGSTVISGSYNYSQNAERNNNEAFLIIKRAPTVANAFEGEFDRLTQAAKVNHPPAHKDKDPEHKTGNEP
jgi:phosphatidylserine/phosphatidylglycerophosphate/cardiolipin synthase-like enzyme